MLHTDKVGGRQWDGAIVRLAMLMTHYREPIDFSVKRLEEAENLLVKMQRRVEEGEDKGSLDAFIATLHDDLNSSAAIHALNDLSGNPLREALEFMGLPASADTSGVDEAAIASLISERLQHFKDKNWGEADRIRDELLADGIQLKDGKDADTGERVTTWELKR